MPPSACSPLFAVLLCIVKAQPTENVPQCAGRSSEGSSVLCPQLDASVSWTPLRFRVKDMMHRELEDLVQSHTESGLISDKTTPELTMQSYLLSPSPLPKHTEMPVSMCACMRVHVYVHRCMYMCV